MMSPPIGETHITPCLSLKRYADSEILQVTKVEARFRFAGLKYRSEAGSVQQAPRGKIPYLELISDSAILPTTLSDSTVIIANLVDDGLLPDLNASLSPVGRAHDLGLRSLLEDKWYFYQASHITPPYSQNKSIGQLTFF